MNQWKPVGIKCEAGRKEAREREGKGGGWWGGTFRLEGPVPFFEQW